MTIKNKNMYIINVYNKIKRRNFMKNKLIKMIVATILTCLLSLSFVACDEEQKHEHSFGEWETVTSATLFEDGEEKRVCEDDATHEETRVTDALGKTANVFDFFTTYASASVKNDVGIVLNKDTESNSGASTYFGETDKNYDWNGAETTISFDLDLSAMEENDFTIFVLGFNKQSGDNYVHVDEIRIGIAKTADGFVFDELIGVGYDDASDLAQIIDGEKTFTESAVTVSFKIAFDADVNELDYTISVNDDGISNSKTTADEVVGLRYLWNAYLKGDGVVLSNLVKA